VLFLTFDEEGGFFDHMVPATPPQTHAQGLSTVPTTNEIFPGDSGHPSAAYGLGMRVPMIVISPWTKGGWVNSQVFDHTSLIRFLEARFSAGKPDLIETNITPWRRAVAGDLTSVFDFANPNAWQGIVLPDTDSYEPNDFVRHNDQGPKPPSKQVMPGQAKGVRPARPLPYSLHAQGHINDAEGSFVIDFVNAGTAAAVFQVRLGHSANAPRTYTVGAGKTLSDSWGVISVGTSEFDLSVHGPNGFLRTFKGSVGQGGANVETRDTYDVAADAISLALTNRSDHPVALTIRNLYSGAVTHLSLTAGASATRQWPLSQWFGWYDLVITVDGEPQFENRLAGHLETGQSSFSDPLMGGLVG
jgi:phospholipase C